MKKCNWKRVLALGLVLTMTMGFAGCEKAGGDGENSGSSGGLFGGGKDKTNNVNAELAKQYVYRCEELDIGLPKDENSSFNIMASSMSGDKVYLLSNEYNYSEDGQETNLVLYSLGKDGTGGEKHTMEIPASESNLDGSGAEADKPDVETSKDIAVDFEEKYGEESYYYESNYFNSAVIAGDKIYALRNYCVDSYQDDGEYVSFNNNYIDCWDLQGKLVWETPMDMEKYQNEEEWSYVRFMLRLSDDRVALMMGGDQSGMIFVEKDGTLSELKKSSSEKDYFEKQSGAAVLQDGTMILSYYNDDWTKQYLTTYDPVKDTFGQEYNVPDAASYNGLYNFVSGTDRDIIYSGTDGLYAFNLGDTEVVKIMDFVNSDLPVYGLNNILFLDNETFFASYNDMVDYQMHFCKFQYVKPEDVQEKQVLVYAGAYIDYNVKKSIIDFNKTNSKYRITVKDYSIYNTAEDYLNCYTKLNNDIIAGSIPDILVLDSMMPVDSYIAKGLLADVDELIQKDEELSKVEFMDNVFEAYRVNGKLYRVIPTFLARTWIGKKSLIGDRTGWTMDELKQVAEGISGDIKIFGDYSRESFLNAILQFCGNDFVDVNTGKCSFDSQLFVSLLEYAKTLPTEEELYGGDYDEEYWMNSESQYRENRTLLMNCSMYNLAYMRNNINGYFGEEVVYVGFPTENGNGSYVEAINSYGISAKGNVEGAWEFLRTFLTEEYQRNENNKYGYSYGLPILKELVREKANESTQKPFWINEETGEKTEYDDTFWMNGEEIPIQPLTQAQADELFEFVCSITKAAYYNEDVNKIVNEEAEAFFAGQKSAQDVVGMIQNRVQLYVNENL